MKDRDQYAAATSHEKTYYSQFVVLVCNNSSEQDNSELQNRIVEGLTNKWKLNHDDPTGERLHIIYLDREDDYDAPKFKPLRHLDHQSRVYIVGHCRPGSDVIESDNNYPVYNPKTKKEEFKRHGFHFTDLGLILLRNINPNLRINRDAKEEDINLHSLNRRLRISIPSCFSGADKIDQQGKVIEKSFSEKLFSFLINHGQEVLKCDVLASKGYLIPFPTEAYFYDMLKYTLSKDRTKLEASFHKRYLLVKGHELFSIFPRHKPSGIDYKPLFCISSDATIKDFREATIGISKLTVDEGYQRLNQQIIAERCLEKTAYIKNKNYPTSIVNKAKFIELGIQSGELPSPLLIRYYEELNDLTRSFDHQNEITRPKAK